MWKSFWKKEKSVEKPTVHIHKIQIVCAIVGILLYVAAEWTGDEGDVADGKLRRPGHGQGEQEYELLVEGLEEEEVPFILTVGEKQYGDKEAKEIFRQVWEQLLLIVPAENPSLSQVRTGLEFPGWMEEYGVRIRWFSEDQELIDNYGNVFNEDNPSLTEQGKTIWLKAVISDGRREEEFQIPATVYPPAWTGKEKREKGLVKAIREEDVRQEEEDWLVLPAEYEGISLKYRGKEDHDGIFFPAAGFFMAILYGFREKQEAAKEQKRRSRQLLLDYSEVISRLMVFIGAGMTVRGAWGKMVADYEKRKKEKGGKIRYAYEEMSRTYYQISAGKAEGEAYEEFGKRCGLPSYMKLSGLLLQNRKEGMKNLNQLMKAEMVSAFEERKNLARRQGEEAGTKLLIPLFLMLGVVMVMVMAPAMLAFS